MFFFFINKNLIVCILLDLKQELESQKHKQSSKLIEHNELKSRIESLHEKLNMQKQLYDQDMKTKNDEIKKLKHEYDALRNRNDEREKFQKDLLNNHESNISELLLVFLMIKIKRCVKETI